MDWLHILNPNGYQINCEQLTAFEKRIGISLPSDYRDFLLSFNGGHISKDHSLNANLYGYEEELELENLWPLIRLKGVYELHSEHAYFFWKSQNVGYKSAFPIGDDGGTGYFFLMLHAPFRGQVYFSYKDELATESNFDDELKVMPSHMAFVSVSFSNLFYLINEQGFDK